MTRETAKARGERGFVAAAVAAIATLTVLRFVAGARLPLFSDEVFYWLLSRHLAWGYFDHPPALPFLIRAGTAVFGDTSLGVRVAGMLLSIPASLLVWRTAYILLDDLKASLSAALFYNLTVLVTANSLAALPDAPAFATSAGFVWALAELATTGRARWWLAAGAFAGLGLLTKYTMLFLGAGAVLWLLWSPDARAWLRTPWPWLGGALAALIFAPNLMWNAEHDWATFGFVYERSANGSLGWRHLGQYLGGYVGGATPLLLLLSVHGLWRASRSPARKLILLPALAIPGFAYLFVHATHASVQGNWPSFLYPLLAIGAALAVRDQLGYTVIRVAAAPLAAAVVAAIYLQAFFQIVPLGREDYVSRTFGFGWEAAAQDICAEFSRQGARGFATTEYAGTALLAFYLPCRAPIVQIAESQHFLDAPLATSADLSGTLLLVNLRPSRPDVLSQFDRVEPLPTIYRKRDGVAIAPFYVLRLSGFHGAPVGRVPVRP